MAYGMLSALFPRLASYPVSSAVVYTSDLGSVRKIQAPQCFEYDSPFSRWSRLQYAHKNRVKQRCPSYDYHLWGIFKSTKLTMPPYLYLCTCAAVSVFNINIPEVGPTYSMRGPCFHESIQSQKNLQVSAGFAGSVRAYSVTMEGSAAAIFPLRWAGVNVRTYVYVHRIRSTRYVVQNDVRCGHPSPMGELSPAPSRLHEPTRSFHGLKFQTRQARPIRLYPSVRQDLESK